MVNYFVISSRDFLHVLSILNTFVLKDYSFKHPRTCSNAFSEADFNRNKPNNHFVALSSTIIISNNQFRTKGLVSKPKIRGHRNTLIIKLSVSSEKDRAVVESLHRWKPRLFTLIIEPQGSGFGRGKRLKASVIHGPFIFASSSNRHGRKRGRQGVLGEK